MWHCDRRGRVLDVLEGGDRRELPARRPGDRRRRLRRVHQHLPGGYAGRWPHVHFEVYPSLADATSASNKLRTSQLALPEDVVQAGLRRPTATRRASATSRRPRLDSDNVFGDGYSLQMAKVTGNNDEGYVATLNVPV